MTNKPHRTSAGRLPAALEKKISGAQSKNLFPGFSPTLSRGESLERGWLKPLPLLYTIVTRFHKGRKSNIVLRGNGEKGAKNLKNRESFKGGNFWKQESLKWEILLSLPRLLAPGLPHLKTRNLYN